ncbi:hypothetical protein EVAR_95782_1 [Eumeta japonica]|uniref:Uncharacterized protein n=1 Tax=Eumeta variegata TaxID=151549 RepID=A0A4C1TFC2_EUMVA|nr:hypothetical protein EVAR_95782_1 [Eumeta japonica]
MVTGEQFASRDIVLQARDDTLTRVPDTHKFYDALQYPIIFSKGQEGYHFQVPQINPNRPSVGEARCFMYSVEWQKRGLPHVHKLLWLKDKLRPDQIDNIISAEIPDPNIDKTLHDIIVKNMIHGPCGPENPQCPCMKDGKCTKKFPRKLVKETVLNDHGYPQYRRRAPADGGRTATVKLEMVATLRLIIVG